MKKLLLLAAFAGAFANANAQTTLFSDNFESYSDFIISNIGQYSLIDVDGLNTYVGGVTTTPGVLPWTNAYEKMVCQVFNPSVAGVQNGHDAENSNFDPHSGNKYLAFWAGSPKNGINSNNDWLILPKITLGTGNKISFWVKSLADDYGLEKYKVAIYQGTSAPTMYQQFTAITPVNDAGTEWQNISVDIPSAYDNKPVYLAINYLSSDTYMMLVDDISVTTTSNLGANNVTKNEFAIYADPSNEGMFNIKTSKKINSHEVFAMDGRKVKEEKSSSSVDLKSASKGVYIIKVNFEDGTSSTKQVIKK